MFKFSVFLNLILLSLDTLASGEAIIAKGENKLTTYTQDHWIGFIMLVCLGIPAVEYANQKEVIFISAFSIGICVLYILNVRFF